MGKVSRLFGAGLALATGAFWFTMLTDPPKTEAALADPAPCVGAGQKLDRWFEAEAGRRSLVRFTRPDDFNLMLSWFDAARHQCTSGLTGRSLANLKAVEKLAAAMENRRRPAEED